MIDLSRKAQLDEALELFHFAFRAIVARPDQMLARRGLSRVHHRILYFLHRNPDISVNGLIEILGISKQALNEPLRVLLAKKLVLASPDIEDRRIHRLSLTHAGRQFEGKLSGDQRARFAGVFAQLGPAKESIWRELMRLLLDAPSIPHSEKRGT